MREHLGAQQAVAEINEALGLVDEKLRSEKLKEGGGRMSGEAVQPAASLHL
jgi:hypothetical protein